VNLWKVRWTDPWNAMSHRFWITRHPFPSFEMEKPHYNRTILQCTFFAPRHHFNSWQVVELVVITLSTPVPSSCWKNSIKTNTIHHRPPRPFGPIVQRQICRALLPLINFFNQSNPTKKRQHHTRDILVATNNHHIVSHQEPIENHS